MPRASITCEAFQADLPDLIYGEFEGERRAALEGHAAGCPACRELWEEVAQVKGALPTPALPPQLGTRLKLLARDHLLAQEPPAADRTGGPIHLALIALLGMCLVGFGLGVAFQRQRDESPTPRATLPFLEPPEGPDDLPRDPPRPTGTAIPPQAGPAWQRILHDAAQERLAGQRWEEAERLFRRAAKVAPQGPLAASARAGAAEALLRRGERSEALAELEVLRRELQAGLIPGGAPLLQRVAELTQSASGD